MSQGGHHGRIHAYRTAKRAVLGTQSQGPSPAWKGGDRSGSNMPRVHREPGSKILISRLPPDVTLQEVSVSYRFSGQLTPFDVFATQRICSTRPSGQQRRSCYSTTTKVCQRGWRWSVFRGTATRLWLLTSMTGDLWTTVSRFPCFLLAASHCGVRTTVEGRGYRGQERSLSSKEDFRERIAISTATPDDSIGKDANRTRKRPSPVSISSFAEVYIPVLSRLTVYLCLL